jgi:WD40 repeat protein
LPLDNFSSRTSQPLLNILCDVHFIRFEQILLLPGHRGSVWALEVSPQDGAQVVSVGQDRTVRVWERGEDLVFVEEER